MGNRSEHFPGRSTAAAASPLKPPAPPGRRWRSALRSLCSDAVVWWRDDEAVLRALAAMDDERISELSEEGRALRRAARRRFRLHP